MLRARVCWRYLGWRRVTLVSSLVRSSSSARRERTSPPAVSTSSVTSFISSSSSLHTSSDFPHKFVKTLPDTIDLTEKDMFVLKVTTQENFATVRWFKDGEEIKNVRKRSQRMKTISTDCQHILAIEKVLVSDAGSFTAATNTESTSCLLTVAGECPS